MYSFGQMNVGVHDRFADFFDHARIGQVRGIINLNDFAACRQDFVDHARGGRDDIHVVFASEPFLNDLHVKQAEKSAAKPKPSATELSGW